MLKKFPHYIQPDEMSCGATCLRMIAKHYGKSYNVIELVQISGTNREGTNLEGLSEAAEKIGFRTLGVKVPFNKLVEDAPLPCIAHWNQNHFVVIYKIKKDKIYVADPAHGLLVYKNDEFIKSWVSDGKDEGVLLLLEHPNFIQIRVNLKQKRISKVSFFYSAI